MLPKQYRLKNKSAFAATYRVKHSYYKKGIALFVGVLKKDPNQLTRAGFVVSKKTSKRSVKRNRLRRLMRESYRLLLKEGIPETSQKYMSLVFVGHERALDKSLKDIKPVVEELLKGIA